MNLFTFIKERVSILDSIGEYVTLKRAGNYYKGTCPFHHEKTASFTVSPDKGIFYCFGCHLSGDVISFMAKIDNCSQKEAAQLLCERYQIELPKTLSFDVSEKKAEEKNHYFGICKAVALWCHEQLMKNQAALSYFQKRGFTQGSISYFMLGYFPGGSAGITNLLYHMKKESILAKDLIEAHILAEGRANIYSPFEERLIFPIQDTLGRHCAFGGRTFKEYDTRAKYYNSRENDYFVKGSLLFNLDRAKKSIQETSNVFLVEGYTDCIAMIQHNMPNTVATLGTACTIEHLKQLSRYAEHLFVMYDNDNAGQQAMLRLTELCWQVNLELKVIILPLGEDPASFLSKNETITELVHNAQDIFFFFLETLGEKFINKPLSQKLTITRSFLTIINTLSDPLKRDLLLQKASKTFDIPFESLREELKKIDIPSSPLPLIKNNPSGETDPSLSTLEKRIFCAIMNNVQLIREENRHAVLKYLPTPLKEIVKQLKETQKNDKALTFSRFFDMLNEHHKQYVGKLLLEDNEHIDMHEFDRLLAQLQKKQWKIITHDIKAQLTRAKQEGDSAKISLILNDFMGLQNKMLKYFQPMVDDNDIKKHGGGIKNDKNN